MIIRNAVFDDLTDKSLDFYLCYRDQLHLAFSSAQLPQIQSSLPLGIARRLKHDAAKQAE
jgi:hypothetical protein